MAAAALCFAAPCTWGFGLGKLAVQSSLGEALRAEIDVTSMTPEEAANLEIRVASPEAYRNAGVDYNSILPNTRAVLQRRPNGRSLVRLTSDRAVQEPFVDVILEITWASGKLVREYTLLFDPPTFARAPAPSAPVPAAQAPVTAPIIAAAPPVRTEVAPPPRAAERRPAPPSATTAVAAPQGALGGVDEYRVRGGDSLSRIASRTARPGVSLDQMLVALYRSNPQAFIDNNMNRLKSGVVLAVPSAEAAKGIDTSEARRVIQAQSADFGAYRQRFAGAVPAAQASGSTRQASGKVQASVDDRKQTAAPAPDKLTLSKGAASAASAAVEDQISKERERKEAAARVAELSKNVAELKDLKGAASAAAKASAPAVAMAPVSPVPVASAAAPAAVALPAPSPPPLAAVKAPEPASSPAAPAVIPPEAPMVAAAPKPIATASAPVLAKPTADEPSFLSNLIDENPLALGGLGVAALLLAGFGVYRFTRRSRPDSGETSFLESRLQPDSFFGASGGQRIDTRDANGASSSMSYSLSQLDAIGDVDPVAEADVYLAYGRDLQAEEILKEAMRANPERMAIRTKLLEVYAKRRDTKGFELLATQLFTLTRGEGEDWAKAQELGAQIDPDNALFRPGGAPPLVQGAGGEIVEILGASTMPQSVLPTHSQFGAPDSMPASIDKGDLDLDLDAPDFGTPTAPSPLEATQSFAPSALGEDSMSLDFSLPDVVEAAPAASRAAAAPVVPDFDLDVMSLDLDLPDTPNTVSTTPAAFSGARFDDSKSPASDEIDSADPLARKLELADEFRQIGDADGARDLLEEVVAKASGAVKARAQAMLADLG